MQIEDQGAGHQITIDKSGFPDAVVWNPWAEKAKGMGDFGDDEYTVRPETVIGLQGLHATCAKPSCRTSSMNRLQRSYQVAGDLVERGLWVLGQQSSLSPLAVRPGPQLHAS